MTKHQDTGQCCLVIHHDGHGDCFICTCGAHVRPHQWREHTDAAIMELAAKRDAEAAVIEAAKAFAARPSLITEQVLIGFVSTLRALEEDA
jgi:hypothetical protein